MKLGVIGDIHANRPALEAVLDDMPDVDALVCTGDVIGILGWNDWTVETVRDECLYTVFGNHEARVRSDFAYAPSFPAAHDEHAVVTDQLDEEHIDWIERLPERIEASTYVLAHSWPFYTREQDRSVHGYTQGDRGVQPSAFTEVGPHLDGRIALLGHTHEQHAVDVSKFEGQSGLVLNPGSVGVPWYTDAEYAVVDTTSHEYDLRSVEYENERVKGRLADLGYPVGKYANDRY